VTPIQVKKNEFHLVETYLINPYKSISEYARTLKSYSQVLAIGFCYPNVNPTILSKKFALGPSIELVLSKKMISRQSQCVQAPVNSTAAL
jgi:hypothetical protein